MHLIESLGLFSIAVAAIAWLAKALWSQFLSRDLEKHRSLLEREALEHRVRFSRLHEKQAAVLEEYYDYLRCARDCIAGFRASKASGASDGDKQFLNKATEYCLRAACHHRANELYFGNEIADRASKLEMEIFKYSSWSSGVMMLLAELDMSKVPDDRRAMVESTVKESLQKIEDQITPLLSALRVDFQRHLGVTTKDG